MNACRFEPQIIEAAERDQWSTTLREHLASCDDCIAAASVSPWMQRFANTGDREHRLPDASIVFLKARLMQGSIELRRASRPMDVVQMLAYLVVAGGWAMLLTWKWKAVELWLKGFTPTGILIPGSARSDSLSMSFFAIVIVLASMTVMLALHTIMAEE
jgi:hypothetical protein